MQRMLVVLALVGLFSPLCLAQKWLLEPSTIVVRDDPARVTGSFRRKRDDSRGVASSMLGGACLIADLRRPGHDRVECKVDKDCARAWRAAGSRAGVPPARGGGLPAGPRLPADLARAYLPDPAGAKPGSPGYVPSCGTSDSDEEMSWNGPPRRAP